VTTWLRAAGISDDYADYYYFLASVGRKTESVATQLFLLLLRILPFPDRLLAGIDDSPTKRYGPHVEGADIHHNPTPGPADQKYLYGHIWVTLSLAFRHPLWGAMALPLRAMLYVRRKTIPAIPEGRNWTFRTKLEMAADLVEWLMSLVKKAGKTRWVVVDGGYTKLPFLRRASAAGVAVVGRLRKDAALRDLPRPLRPGQRRGRGRPRKYGKNKIRLAKRAGQKRGWQTVACTLYNETTTIRRPRDDRAGLPRHQGSLRSGPAASTQHLDQRRRLPSESLDAYPGGTLGVAASPRSPLRSSRLTVGRRRSPSFSCQPPQCLAAASPTQRIIVDHGSLVVAAINPPIRTTPHGARRLNIHVIRKVQKSANRLY
jgi:hypothetical protein